MPPSLASRDSSRTLQGRRRAPRGQLARSGSIFGAIKNIVTAPLAWFTTYDDTENVSGKRGRNIESILENEGVYHEEQPSAKRKRVDSPPAPHQATRTNHGYLDVPANMLSQQSGTHQRLTAPLAHGRSTSLVTSLDVPTTSGVHPARRTASPTGITSYMQSSMIQRTQSMDPPHGMPGSANRDVTMSPSRHTAFQLRPRSSMTPQPTGQTFGPTPRVKERDVSEPPPLAALISKPVFVKPPPQLAEEQPQQPVTTLGTLADKGRTSRSPMRQHSGLFLGARPGSIAGNSSTPFVMPVNAAEKALHDLDVYKTPLLPSRLRGSQTIPDMFKPKKTHAPVLMRSDRDRERKPRLGMSEKGKKEEESAAASKPYAGRGGMKKMLAKRKLEEEEEREKERANAIETDQDEGADKSIEIPKLKASTNMARLPSSPVSTLPTRPVGGREQSSLRVGRTRTSRNHIARPVSKNRFSAAYEEEEEPKKLPTLFESPKGFSFAQDVSDRQPFRVVGNIDDSPRTISKSQKTPISHDTSNAKEPPIAALPFSLSKMSSTPPAAPSVSAPAFTAAEVSKTAFTTVSAPVPAEPFAPKVAEVTSIATSTVPTLPSISLIPPSPAPAKPATDDNTKAKSSSNTASTIPNFFASSSIFAKPGVTIPPPASSGGSTNSIAEPAKPVLASAFSFNAPAPPESAPAEAAAAAPFSFTIATAPPSSTPASLTNPSAKAAAPTPPTQTTSTVPDATKPSGASTASSNPFNFGVSSAPTPTSTTAAPVATPAAAAAAPFTFGPTKAEPAKVPEVKPVFEPAKPSLFGGAPASQASPTFSFAPSNANPTIEAPKPLFPSTSTGGAGGFNFGAPAQAFGATSSTPPPAFNFGAPSTPAAPAPRTLFGGPSNGSNGTDTPVRSEMQMEESPTRGGGMDMGGEHASSALKPPSTGFSFGAPSASTPFGQPSAATSSPFPFVAKTEPKPETKPAMSTFASFGQNSSGSAFSFGPKSTDAVPSPTSPASFGGNTPFGQTPTTSSSGFNFGAPTITTSGFGQPSSNSQPASPSTFGQQASFGFGTPTSTTAPFAFGSQPASPATGNAGLPQPPGSSGGTGFPFGASSQSPSSPFGAPSALPASGGVSFTIGSAAPQAPPGGRPVKKLPNRRGGRR
ncbi:hypothetical protein C8Q80DRAFT_1316526 [Daedaleopsis nitida]|nr:hypothetical protein C8Q80DRAFT_1316526 [Daedaleopsis nitida]